MINYFRATLANVDALAPVNEGDLTDSTFIPVEYTAIALTSAQTALQAGLFPSATRANVIAYTDAYTLLLHSFGMDDVFTKFYPTVSYQLSDLGSFPANTGNYQTNLLTIWNTIVTGGLGKAFFNNATDTKYSQMYRLATPHLQRLAGLVAGYAVSFEP